MFEQGPIRPPSEANSILVRVSRNCPWNRCAFCPVYDGERFSLRSVDEVFADLAEMRPLYGDGPRTAFLQDANPLATKPDDLVKILGGIRSAFPNVRRITAYARAHTLTRRSLDELKGIRAAGLDRLHVGLESGCDAVLTLVHKGVSRAVAIEGGQRAKAAGFELSEYVMPGLGGRQLSEEHAADTASALVAIAPDFVRLRTTAAVPGTELHAMQLRGEHEPLGEVDTVVEIRDMLLAMGAVRTRLESDHVLNLLMELRGDLPDDRERLVESCDELITMPKERQILFILGRRLGWISSLRQLDQDLEASLQSTLETLTARGRDIEDVLAELRTRVL